MKGKATGRMNEEKKGCTVVYFDGLCEPVNPRGIATYGFVIYRDGEKIFEGCGVVGAGMFGDDVTNNVAEYTALIKALEWLVEQGYTKDEVTVRGDSQLTIRQLNGVYAVRSMRILPLYKKARELVSKFEDIWFEWVPREENEEADSLSRKAYREFLKKHGKEARKYYERYFATEKQLRFIEQLGGKADSFLSKREASKLIEQLLLKKRRRERRKMPEVN